MMRKIWIELYKSNSVVTHAYLHAIANAFSSLGCTVDFYDTSDKVPGSREDCYVVAIAPSVAKLYLSGCRNIVYWAQGVWPEESFMRHESQVRFAVCSQVERFALRVSKRVFLVSDAQRKHYERKYALPLGDKAFIMPCSNETIHESSFFVNEKYSKPTFVYAGSLAPYQCIGEMLSAFREIEESLKDSKLLFYTSQMSEAQQLINASGIKNYVLGCREPDELSDAIAVAKYGFVIRHDNVVNRVATPTKLSTYISNGIIPIYSSCIESFEETASGIPRVAYRGGSFVQDVLEFESRHIDAEGILKQYSKYFTDHLHFESKTESIKDFVATMTLAHR